MHGRSSLVAVNGLLTQLNKEGLARSPLLKIKLGLTCIPSSSLLGALMEWRRDFTGLLHGLQGHAKQQLKYPLRAANTIAMITPTRTTVPNKDVRATIEKVRIS